ncbi:MAG: hypothetical protein JOZ22_13920, partial [Acidobacteriia bacterium]|nr:hypothetical protein [Terriglobia bacterium]
VRGYYTWDQTDPYAKPGTIPEPRFADLTDDASPVILQAGEHGAFPTLASFEDAVLRMPLRISANAIELRGLYEADVQFFPGGAPPRVSGRPLDLEPDFTFRSPYVNEDWNSGVVRITDGAGHNLTLDFNTPGRK